MANSLSFLIVDSKYKAILERHASFELLPVELQIAPKKLVKAGWWIANPIEVRRAVDRKRSDWKPDVEPGKIRLFKKLVLRKDAIADRPTAFRLEEMPTVILFREDLVAAARKAKLTGLIFVEPEKFNSL